MAAKAHRHTAPKNKDVNQKVTNEPITAVYKFYYEILFRKIVFRKRNKSSFVSWIKMKGSEIIENESKNTGELVKADDSLKASFLPSSFPSSLCYSTSSSALANQPARLQHCEPLLRVLRDN